MEATPLNVARPLTRCTIVWQSPLPDQLCDPLGRRIKTKVGDTRESFINQSIIVGPNSAPL